MRDVSERAATSRRSKKGFIFFFSPLPRFCCFVCHREKKKESKLRMEIFSDSSLYARGEEFLQTDKKWTSLMRCLLRGTFKSLSPLEPFFYERNLSECYWWKPSPAAKGAVLVICCTRISQKLSSERFEQQFFLPHFSTSSMSFMQHFAAHVTQAAHQPDVQSKLGNFSLHLRASVGIIKPFSLQLQCKPQINLEISSIKAFIPTIRKISIESTSSPAPDDVNSNIMFYQSVSFSRLHNGRWLCFCWCLPQPTPTSSRKAFHTSAFHRAFFLCDLYCRRGWWRFVLLGKTMRWCNKVELWWFSGFNIFVAGAKKIMNTSTLPSAVVWF